MLILLPVACWRPSAGGRCDRNKILAEHDARERAANHRGWLLFQIFSARTDGNGVADKRRMYLLWWIRPAVNFSPAWIRGTTPQPLNGRRLGRQQARLRKKVRKPFLPGPTGMPRRKTVNDFIASGPPENFAAAACYDSGLLLARRKKSRGGWRWERLHLLLEKFPEAVGESAASFQPLAQFRLLELERE